MADTATVAAMVVWREDAAVQLPRRFNIITEEP